MPGIQRIQRKIKEEKMLGAIILQVVLIFLNAIFASAEIAVISMNDTKLENMARKGNKKAKKLVDLTAQPARFLATIQVAITLAGFFGSAYAADNFAEPLVKKLVEMGVSASPAVLNSVCVFVITIIIAYFSIVFGELIPKRIAMNKTEQIALSVSGVLSVVSVVFKPLVWLLTTSTNLVLKLIGINPEEDETVTEEEIRMMVTAGSEKGVIDSEENEMIQNVLDFNDISVEELCTHRTDVVMLYTEDSLADWKETITNSRHNYMPVCGEDSDDIIGVMDVRDFFRMEWSEGLTKETVLEKCLRKAYFVPENMKADVLCKRMKETGVHFAVAIDEYGGMSGIATMHDLVELLIGELFEEGETPRPAEIEPLGENKWKIQGFADIEDVAEELDIALPMEEYDTFGGYILGEMGNIPPDGTAFELETDRLMIKVENVKEHRVASAVVTKKNE